MNINYVMIASVRTYNDKVYIYVFSSGKKKPKQTNYE